MKKLTILLVIMMMMMMLVFCLSGCDGKDPYIQVQNNGWNYSSFNREIQIDKGYEMDQSHSYDIVETSEGIDVIIHYKATAAEEGAN